MCPVFDRAVIYTYNDGLTIRKGGTIMARLAFHDAQSPLEIKPSAQSVWVCRCGLTKNQPFCDGSHKLCSDEEGGKTYDYDRMGHRKEVKT